MVFTHGPAAHLPYLATRAGLGTIFRSSGIVRFVQGGVVKTFRWPTQAVPMPIAEPVKLGFSTADADHPSMTYNAGDLALMFRDWQEQQVCVIFRGVSRFEWTDEPDDYFDGEPYDGACLVLDSGWPPQHARSTCKHYRLNFNACGGRLDVACESIGMENQP